jgi:hypothetical protein
MRKLLRRLVSAGVLAGAAYTVWRAWNAHQPPDEQKLQWEASPFPYPPVPRAGRNENEGKAPVSPSSDPNADGTCPVTHPVKAKLTSGIYHVPGGANYDRTKPDRCYVDEAAAMSDGLRRSKI